jgi:hypothetical protein
MQDAEATQSASYHPAKQRDGMSGRRECRHRLGWPIHNRVRPPRTRVPAVSPHRTCPKGMEPVSLAKISLPLLSQLREQNPSNCAIRSLNGLAIACHYHARPGTPREPTAKKQALAGLELMSFLIEHREWSHWRMIKDDR